MDLKQYNNINIMPITKTDYSQTVVYKIVCKDFNITYCYIGHTTNFRQRKSHRKSVCHNSNFRNYDFLVYTFIRENGGWDNWEMIEIEKFDCKDGNEARVKEHYWLETLKADLNKCVPTRTLNEYRKTIEKIF